MATAPPLPNESPITYPCDFPIKAMGLNVPGLIDLVTDLVRPFDPHFDASTIEQRKSSGAKYLGLTLTVHATSREQLDDIYRALSGHPSIRYVL